MTEENPDPIEQAFLDDLCSRNTPLTIFLMNGVKLQGTIGKVGTHTLILVRAGHSQLIYRHAISSVLPDEQTTA